MAHTPQSRIKLSSKRNIAALLERAQSGLPIRGAPKPLYDLYRNMQRIGVHPEVLVQIQSIRPDWFGPSIARTTPITDQHVSALLDLARSGLPRPSKSKSQTLYRWLQCQIRRGTHQDLIQQLRDLRPDWWEPRIKITQTPIPKPKREPRPKPEPKPVREPKVKLAPKPQPHRGNIQAPEPSGVLLGKSSHHGIADRSPTCWDVAGGGRNPYRGVPGLGILCDLWRAGKAIPPGPLQECLRGAIDETSPSYNDGFAALVATEAPHLIAKIAQAA